MIRIHRSEENQARFHGRFNLINLLSAPARTMSGSLAARTGNPYGKAPADMDRILRDLATIEPLLWKSAHHEIRITIPLADVAAEVLHLAGVSPPATTPPAMLRLSTGRDRQDPTASRNSRRSACLPLAVWRCDFACITARSVAMQGV